MNLSKSLSFLQNVILDEIKCLWIACLNKFHYIYIYIYIYIFYLLLEFRLQLLNCYIMGPKCFELVCSPIPKSALNKVGYISLTVMSYAICTLLFLLNAFNLLIQNKLKYYKIFFRIFLYY